MLDAFKEVAKFIFTRINFWLVMGIYAAFLQLFSPPWWIFSLMVLTPVVLGLFVCTVVIYCEKKEHWKKVECNWTADELDRLAKLKQLNEQFFEISELTCLNCKSKVKASKCIGPDVHYICSKCNDGFMIDLSELETEDKA